MLLAQDVATSALSGAQLALYPVAIVALGALVKWWMSGLVASVKTVADEVKVIVERLGSHERQIGVLDERTSRLRADLDRISEVRDDARHKS